MIAATTSLERKDIQNQIQNSEIGTRFCAKSNFSRTSFSIMVMEEEDYIYIYIITAQAIHISNSNLSI
ncbi:hypothetical protein L1887_08955 [Cichorium endivia]|nr:hypothetical protein L1887_08955 [Cichorium endivia]